MPGKGMMQKQLHSMMAMQVVAVTVTQHNCFKVENCRSPEQIYFDCYTDILLIYTRKLAMYQAGCLSALISFNPFPQHAMFQFGEGMDIYCTCHSECMCRMLLIVTLTAKPVLDSRVLLSSVKISVASGV